MAGCRLYYCRRRKIFKNIRDTLLKKVKVKQSRYTPWRRLGGEEV
jgi:hypothetical protein